MPKTVRNRKLVAKVLMDGTNRSLQRLYRANNKAYFGNQLPNHQGSIQHQIMPKTYGLV